VPPGLRPGPLRWPAGTELVAATRQHAINDAARFKSLYDGVSVKIFERLPDATWVYPGHGGDTTVGAERPHLREWAERGW
jgi:glyoxylase-like metal-dependent hydrolase (beta-lactamase superfamily II)